MVLEPAAVEHDRVDAGAFARSPTSSPTALAAATVPVAPLARVRLPSSTRDATRATGDVVDHLRVDVLVGAEHREARARGGARDLLAHPAVPPLSVLTGLVRLIDVLVYFADLPALRRTRSSGVADALALVGLGLADLADVGGDLADELLVDAPDDDAGRRGTSKVMPVGRLDGDRVREADRELELVRALRHGAVADADDLELLG